MDCLLLICHPYLRSCGFTFLRQPHCSSTICLCCLSYKYVPIGIPSSSRLAGKLLSVVSAITGVGGGGGGGGGGAPENPVTGTFTVCTITGSSWPRTEEKRQEIIMSIALPLSIGHIIRNQKLQASLGEFLTRPVQHI